MRESEDAQEWLDDVEEGFEWIEMIECNSHKNPIKGDNQENKVVGDGEQ